ncbi:hypothetical protein RUM43_000387 [Polyplax serrata]|uniref:Uncharacterized protein n=1 Tax=Polyplax serrata TaxID=468196 RepID=A0AAN8SGY6_POLSC
MRQEVSVMESTQDFQHENEANYWIRTQTGGKKLEDEYLIGDIIGRGCEGDVLVVGFLLDLMYSSKQLVRVHIQQNRVSGLMLQASRCCIQKA